MFILSDDAVLYIRHDWLFWVRLCLCEIVRLLYVFSFTHVETRRPCVKTMRLPCLYSTSLIVSSVVTCFSHFKCFFCSVAGSLLTGVDHSSTGSGSGSSSGSLTPQSNSHPGYTHPPHSSSSGAHPSPGPPSQSGFSQ